jgi:hypothetical protein
VYFAKLPRVAKAPGEFKKEERFTPTSYSGGQKLSVTPSPAEYNIEREFGKKDVLRGGFRHGVEKEQKDRKVGPGRYGKVCGEMISRSFNIHFDPQLKRSPKYRIGAL